MTVVADWVRGTLGSLLVAAPLGAVAFGLPAIDRSLPPERALEATTYLAVSDTIELLPPPGSVLDAGVSRPGTQTGQVRLVVDGGLLDYRIVVRPFGGGLELAARQLHDKVGHFGGEMIVRPAAAGECAGKPCAVGDYLGGPGPDSAGGRGGWYAVMLISDRLVEVVTTGPRQRIADVRPALDHLLAGVRVRAAR